MKKIVVFILLLFITINVYAEENLREVKLIKCENAENMFVEENKIYKRIRLIAYDRMDGEFNKEIDEYVCNLLTNATKIEIKSDEASDKKDKYNRELVWVYVDDNLVDEKIAYTRSISANQYRTDLLGLSAGNHSVKIIPFSAGKESDGVPTVLTVGVSAYDRSGYAHFKYNDGVGAYKDNGTLKDNAIVLYVTDENKNSVTLTYNGKTVSGIGNILNSAGKSCGETGHENECKKVEVYLLCVLQLYCKEHRYGRKEKFSKKQKTNVYNNRSIYINIIIRNSNICIL
jgi:hypothetical protein